MFAFTTFTLKVVSFMLPVGLEEWMVVGASVSSTWDQWSEWSDAQVYLPLSN